MRQPAPRLAKPGLLALLLTAGGLAGCSGDAAEPAAVGLVDVGGVMIAADKAIVAGNVVSDAGLAVPQARVSVLGSDLFTDTDARGAYRLVNVSAGMVELHVTHASYRAHLHRVEVAAGAAVVVDLTLFPLDSAAADLPHLHDHWGGQATYQLLDKTLDLHAAPVGSPYPQEYWTAYSVLYRGNANVTPWDIPLDQTPHGGPALVLPGTASLTATVTWDEAITEGFGLCYAPANRDPSRCLPPQPSPATFTVPVKPQQADSGHQPYSLWRLWLYTRSTTQGSGSAPDVILGEAQVTIELTDGEVLVDPPHPDLWGGGNERLVVDERKSGSSACCAMPPEFYPSDIVPPGTTRIRIEHTWTIDGAPGQAPYEFDLLVRTAAMNPQTTARTEWLQPPAVEGSNAERRKVYEFEVQPGDTDGYYQQSSFWRLSYFQPRYGPDGFEVVGLPHRHHLVMHAIRDA